MSHYPRVFLVHKKVLFVWLVLMACCCPLVTPDNNNNNLFPQPPGASFSVDTKNVREFRVDHAKRVNISKASNNFQQFVRQISEVELAPLMSNYFEYSVNTSIDIVIKDVKKYCTKVLDDNCEVEMQNIFINEFINYATERNYTYHENVVSTMTLDQGFSARKFQRKTIIDRPEDCHFANQAGDNVTVVTGFWDIDQHKYSHHDATSYYEWFKTSLRINMPYIFFTDPETLPGIVEFRTHLPTLYVLWERRFFVAADNYPPTATHPEHVPSTDVAKIWLEKMILIRYAKQLVHSEFYVWVDAGISSFRNRAPFPQEWSKEMFHMFPKDRISYSRIPGRYHNFAATVIVFPRAMVEFGCYLFYQEYSSALRNVGDWRVGSEQFIWTTLVDKYPELFHAMSYDYGEIDFLWGSSQFK